MAKEEPMIDNALFISVDSLRYDRIKLIENRISALDNPQFFTRTYATGPGTTPSFPAMLTGTLPLSYEGLGPLSQSRPRVGELVQNEGMITAGFQCNPFLSSHFNYDRGYDTFEDYQNPLMGIATKIFPRGIEINNPKLKHVDEALHLTNAIKKTYQLVKGKPRPYVSAEVITDDTIKWLDQTNDPFFCWTHYMDVHHPCYPPSEYREANKVGDVTQSDVSELYSTLLRKPKTLSETDIESLCRLYDAAIQYVFDQIDFIVSQLKESGKFENTLIVITSDHGELFGEYNQYGKPERMYDELLHVPLIIENGSEYLDEVTDDLVSLLDIPPLIHDALGLKIPDEYEGRIPGKDEPRDFVMAEHEVGGEVIVGARSEDWLYEGDEINGEHRLFDLRNNFEQVDRNHPGAAAVRKAVLARLEKLDIEAKYLQSDIKSDVEDRLEDLGYL